MERQLDEVEDGRRSWTEFLHSFYGDFKTTMGKAEAEMNRVEKPLEEIDEICPDCGRNLVIRTGRFGRFVSCSGFPECRYRRSFVNKTGALCPNCHGDLVERKTRQKKRVFYGCANYPTCNFAIWERPIPDLCPKCGGLMVVVKEGQEPVCYNEVIVPQRSSADKPKQEAQKTTRTTRRKASATNDEAGSEAPKTTRRSTAKTASKKDTAVSEDGVVPLASRKTTTRTRTTRRAVAGDPAAAKTSTRKRSTTTRAKAPAKRQTKTTKTL
jgi:DNA topoisomerase-1